MSSSKVLGENKSIPESDQSISVKLDIFQTPTGVRETNIIFKWTGAIQSEMGQEVNWKFKSESES